MGKSHILGNTAEEEILGFLTTMAGRVEVTKASDFLQTVWGDFTILRQDKPFGIELKAEQSNRYGNLFLETWSNRKWRTLGWMYKLRGDSLFYYFVEEKELWTLRVDSLLDWAFGADTGDGQIYRFPEKKQCKHDQKNDSWGRCVPIAVLQKELGGDIKQFRLNNSARQKTYTIKR